MKERICGTSAGVSGRMVSVARGSASGCGSCWSILIFLLRGLLCGLGCGGRIRGEPLIEGDGEGEELLLAVEGMDHLDVELGAFERWVVEAANVVEEISGDGAVSVDDGALEAEVVVILGNLLVDGGVVDGDGEDGILGSLRTAGGEEAAVDVVVQGGGGDVAVGGDELDARLFEREGGVAVVGDDDADGDEAVLDVGEAEEGAVFGVRAGLGGDGDVLFW